MRRRTIVMCIAGAISVSACGAGSSSSAGKPRPAAPVNLSVYVGDAKVTVSPGLVGAGPIVFIVTNQARRAESLAISAGGRSSSLASTSPINPQATTQVTVDLRPGHYTIATGPLRATDASAAPRSAIHPASLRVGRERPNSDNVLLQP
jgi:hypothetical protein